MQCKQHEDDTWQRPRQVTTSNIELTVSSHILLKGHTLKLLPACITDDFSHNLIITPCTSMQAVWAIRRLTLATWQSLGYFKELSLGWFLINNLDGTCKFEHQPFAAQCLCHDMGQHFATLQLSRSIEFTQLNHSSFKREYKRTLKVSFSFEVQWKVGKNWEW